jgi:hypothetical protein
MAVAPVWSQIKSSLIAGVETGKLVCPIPHETIWESTPLSEQRYRRVRELQSRLSRGVFFKSFTRLLSEEVLALVRTGVDITPWEHGCWRDLRAQLIGSVSRDDFMKLKKSVEDQVDALTVDSQNQRLRQAELEQFVRKRVVFDLYHNLDRLNAGQALAANCPFTLDVCDFIRSTGVSLAEVLSLKQFVLHHKYEAIPILFYYIRFVAQFEFDLLHGGRRPEANDATDLTRMAMALWGSDAHVCDAEMAQLCKKTKIDRFSNTVILPVGQPDKFLRHLESIL